MGKSLLRRKDDTYEHNIAKRISEQMFAKVCLQKKLHLITMQRKVCKHDFINEKLRRLFSWK